MLTRSASSEPCVKRTSEYEAIVSSSLEKLLLFYSFPTPVCRSLFD